MIVIIGVRFRKSGKIYYFDPAGLAIEKGNHVIVETARGIEYGTVVLGPKEMPEDKIITPLKPVMRVSTPQDDQENDENLLKEKEAFDICLEKISKHELEMKLIDSEYTFDRNKLLFYFTADGRIDFRELVKDLAAVFRTRIELRQIGVRDETKMLGGIAICGRPLCCHSYLSDFAPVSIKMAKEQNLSLNPSKISGVCGRLMCCLKNEQEAYEYLNSTLPNLGTQVETIDGYIGEVQNVSVLKQMVKVIISKENDEKEVRDYHVSELNFDKKNKGKGFSPVAPLHQEEIDELALKQLEHMEQSDLEDLAEENEKPAQRPFKKQKGPKQDFRKDGGNKESSHREYSSRENNKGNRNHPKKSRDYNQNARRNGNFHRKNPEQREHKPQDKK